MWWKVGIRVRVIEFCWRNKGKYETKLFKVARFIVADKSGEKDYVPVSPLGCLPGTRHRRMQD
jgi:hypothetical protein